MSQINVPDESDLLRHVPWAKLRKDGEENVVGVLYSAFQLRDDESGLSVTWLDYFTGTDEEKFHASVAEFSKSYKPSPKSAFALCNAGKIRALTAKSSNNIRIITVDDDNNLAHAEIRRLNQEMELLELLATEGVSSFVQKSQLPESLFI